MTTPPPSMLASPPPWDLVAPAYDAEVVPMFERYAALALRLAAPPPDAAIVDVACGPGTLTLLAAARARRVAALDFSPGMLERLRARIAAAGVANVEPQVGDGQALPYGDAEFDAGFSMFGLIFFPDRARGLAELRRVVRPGGAVVVSSWLPSEQVPAIAAVLGSLREAMPQLPFGNAAAPLGDPDAIRSEFDAAGFTGVEAHQVTFPEPSESAADFWASVQRTMAPIVMMQKRMGADAWRPIAEVVQQKLEDKLGAGRITIEMKAYLAAARC